MESIYSINISYYYTITITGFLPVLQGLLHSPNQILLRYDLGTTSAHIIFETPQGNVIATQDNKWGVLSIRNVHAISLSLWNHMISFCLLVISTVCGNLVFSFLTNPITSHFVWCERCTNNHFILRDEFAGKEVFRITVCEVLLFNDFGFMVYDIWFVIELCHASWPSHWSMVNKYTGLILLIPPHNIQNIYRL